MGDKEHGFLQRPLDVQKGSLQPLPVQRIHRAEGFIHQQDGRIGRQCARHADPLRLPAGELMRVFVQIFLRQAGQLHQKGCPLDDIGLFPFEQFGHNGDVAAHRVMRKEPHVLHHIADAAAQLFGRHPADILPPYRHGAGVGWGQRVDEPQ